MINFNFINLGVEKRDLLREINVAMKSKAVKIAGAVTVASSLASAVLENMFPQTTPVYSPDTRHPCYVVLTCGQAPQQVGEESTWAGLAARSLFVTSYVALAATVSVAAMRVLTRKKDATIDTAEDQKARFKQAPPATLSLRMNDCEASGSLGISGLGALPMTPFVRDFSAAVMENAILSSARREVESDCAPSEVVPAESSSQEKTLLDASPTPAVQGKSRRNRRVLYRESYGSTS